MKYLVIGLGTFGTNLALDLTDIGHEVIAVDQNPEAVERIKDIVATTYILDTSKEDSMALLPLNNIDAAIVTIGNNFGASIKTVALLRKMRIKRLMVRAGDELHEAILQSMDVERILTPEKKAALNLVNELALNSKVESFAIDSDNYVLKFEAPAILVGKNYSTIIGEHFYNLKFIAASRPHTSKNLIGISTTSYELLDEKEIAGTIGSGDILTFFGSLKNFRKFYKDLSE